MKNVSCDRLRQTKKSLHQNNVTIYVKVKTNITDVRTIFDIGKLHDINRSITNSLAHDQTIQTDLFGNYIHKYFIFAMSTLSTKHNRTRLSICVLFVFVTYKCVLYRLF